MRDGKWTGAIGCIQAVAIGSEVIWRKSKRRERRRKDHPPPLRGTPLYDDLHTNFHRRE
jgi:hypothetical protein